MKASGKERERAKEMRKKNELVKIGLKWHNGGERK